MEPTSEQDLKRLLEEGKITQEDYSQLNETMSKSKHTHPSSLGMSASEFALRKRLLIYGFVVCCIGLPAGLLLKLPVVWGLALAGILIGFFKMKSLGIVK
ncbi:MAG: hypothetical protein LLF76_02120 [Planctomycetaceae bacterium]|nr:hypothetical protein [Planctomycetaceae bacterium]